MTNIKTGNFTGNVEGILRGLGDLVEKLGELAEKGEEMKQSGVFDINTGGKDAKAVYGFSVKMGLGGSSESEEVIGFRLSVREEQQIADSRFQNLECEVNWVCTKEISTFNCRTRRTRRVFYRVRTKRSSLPNRASMTSRNSKRSKPRAPCGHPPTSAPQSSTAVSNSSILLFF